MSDLQCPPCVYLCMAVETEHIALVNLFSYPLSGITYKQGNSSLFLARISMMEQKGTRVFLMTIQTPSLALLLGNPFPVKRRSSASLLSNTLIAIWLPISPAVPAKLTYWERLPTITASLLCQLSIVGRVWPNSLSLHRSPCAY